MAIKYLINALLLRLLSVFIFLTPDNLWIQKLKPETFPFKFKIHVMIYIIFSKYIL